MDGYSREALAIEVDTSLPGARVVGVLERLKQERGMTAKIIVDNGPEFLSRVVDQWAYENGVEFHFIEPGKPTQERVHRELQWEIPRRMLEPELVP
jgi:putative transposase